MISEIRVLMLCLLALCLPAGLLMAQTAPSAAVVRWEPFEMKWQLDSSPVDADVSFLLEAPAGKHGFVTVRDGHLYAGANGARLRIWGVNFSFAASMPPKELAPAVAAHLARFGVNCVRIHHHDWRSPRGLIDSKFADSRHLDPVALDRLDFLVAELKKRGIYTDLNLNVARAFQDGDGVRDAAMLGFAKAVTIFDDRIIELEKEFARQYLTHKNPYTGNEYRNEPAIAIVEILNENSLTESWVRGRLIGNGPDLKAADRTWTDIPASYARDLDRRYQLFLGKTLTGAQRSALMAEAGAEAMLPRLQPSQFAKASDLRFRTEAAFYMDLETRFYDEMARFLKDDVGVRQPLVGTSVHAGSLTPYPLLKTAGRLEIVDGHTYWQHPRYFMEGERRRFEIRNTPMVDAPAQSTVMTLGRVAMAGKPYIVSEVNHPYPNEYGAEMIPILAAYAGFQDWDGLFWYSFEHSDASNWKPRPPGHFDIRQDPVKMSQLAAGALLFLRGDVAAARKTVPRSYSAEAVADSLKMPASEGTFFTPGFPPTLPLVHGTRVAAVDRASNSDWPAVSGPPWNSDTGELSWRKDSVSVETARSTALVGRLTKAANRELDVETGSPFAAILLSSMDGKALKASTKLLLTVGGRTSNEGMVWNEARTSTLEGGSAPMKVEAVSGRIVLKGIGTAATVMVQALDGAGRVGGESIRATKVADGWQVDLKAATPWYLIQVGRTRPN